MDFERLEGLPTGRRRCRRAPSSWCRPPPWWRGNRGRDEVVDLGHVVVEAELLGVLERAGGAGLGLAPVGEDARERVGAGRPRRRSGSRGRACPPRGPLVIPPLREPTTGTRARAPSTQHEPEGLLPGGRNEHRRRAGQQRAHAGLVDLAEQLDAILDVELPRQPVEHEQLLRRCEARELELGVDAVAVPEGRQGPVGDAAGPSAPRGGPTNAIVGGSDGGRRSRPSQRSGIAGRGVDHPFDERLDGLGTSTPSRSASLTHMSDAGTLRSSSSRRPGMAVQQRGYRGPRAPAGPAGRGAR